MNNRSKFLLVALAVVGVGVFGDQGYRRFVEQPARKREREAAQIDKQIKEAEDAVFTSVRAADQLLALEQYSLPYDQELARARYQDWLLALVAKVACGNRRSMLACPLPYRSRIAIHASPKRSSNAIRSRCEGRARSNR